MEKVSVLLVDDHEVVRQGMRAILESGGEVAVVGEAGDGRGAVEEAARLKPDVVVMDIVLPGLSGIEATRLISKRSPSSRVLILTVHQDELYIQQAVEAGARGYVLKDAEQLDLLRAVKAVAHGASFFSPAACRVLVEGYLEGFGGRRARQSLALLTEREREVVQLVAEGKTNKQIARLLSVSVNTVETHRKHVMEKLDLHSTADVVRFAVREKIVS